MEFVTPLTFQTLSGDPVASEIFNLTQESEIGHIDLADSADFFVIAPATANVIGKIANGIADDLLTTVLMATQAPVLIAPAMNIHMYDNPILQENLRKLRRVGYHVMEPAEGFLACGYEGKGRSPSRQDLGGNPSPAEAKRPQRREKSWSRPVPIASPSIRCVIFPIARRERWVMPWRAQPRAAARRSRLISGPTALEPPAGRA